MALPNAEGRRRYTLKMHISEKLAEAHRLEKPAFSFEFFPPKTAQVNLGPAMVSDSLYADTI